MLMLMLLLLLLLIKMTLVYNNLCYIGNSTWV
jgi:hypothetical protein